jgi:hypothetical protein
LIWGVGPVFLLPTATKDVLGSEKAGLGPTFVALKQSGPWTVGYLGSHIWSVAGDDMRQDINVTSMQPFFSYTTKTHTTIGAFTETTYDWKGEQWSVPLIVQAGQLFKIGPQILQIAVAGKYWASGPDDGPEGWGMRLQLTLLFPQVVGRVESEPPPLDHDQTRRLERASKSSYFLSRRAVRAASFLQRECRRWIRRDQS